MEGSAVEPRSEERYVDSDVQKELQACTVPFLRNIAPKKGRADEIYQTLISGSRSGQGFSYEHINTVKLEASSAALKKIVPKIDAIALPTLQRLYQAEIRNHIVRRNMLAASSGGDDEKFFLGSREIYGVPSKELIDITAARLQALIAMDVSKGYLKNAQKALGDIVSDVPHTKGKTLLEDAGISAPTSTEDEVLWGEADFVHAFEQELAKQHIIDWKVVIEDAPNFVVRGHEKEIVVPNDARLHDGRLVPVRDTHARALVAHEMVHVQRAHNGAQTILHILSTGFPGYVLGEEGIAWWEQAKIEGANDLPKFEHRVATMLCLGLFDGKKRNLYEVYPLLVDVLTLMHAEEGAAASEEDIQKQAWKVCVRVFRGTTGLTPGACFTKDAVAYADGFLQVVRAVQANPSLEKHLYVGKYDPANEQHVAWLRELNIIT